MNSLITFLNGFLSRKGGHLFSTTMLEKGLNFLVSSMLIWELHKATLGQLTFAQSVMVFFMSFMGLGSNSALLQIGSSLESKKDKKQLVSYTLSTGLLGTLLVCLLGIIVGYYVSNGNKDLFYYFVLLSIRFIPLYGVKVLMVWFRFNFRNDRLYHFEKYYILLQFVLSAAMLYQWGVYGYLSSLILAPLIISLFFFKEIPFQFQLKWNLKGVKEKFFWQYSLSSGITNVLSQLVFVIDAIIIFQLIGDNANAEYRVASLIPFNILFLPGVFMKTDFALIARNKRNRQFLWNYYKNFFKLFLVICLLGFGIGFYFGKDILSIYGAAYSPYSLFIVLLFSACMAILFRVPLGNMIAAFGDVRVNLITTILTLLLDIVLNLSLIPIYGLMGAAYATAIALIFSCITSLGYFLFYIQNLNIKH